MRQTERPSEPVNGYDIPHPARATDADADRGAAGPGGAFWLPLDEITGALESLTGVLDVEDDFQVLLHQVCRQCTHALAGVDEATVTLLNGGEPHTAATTSEQVAYLDRDQYSLGNGPCMEAAGTGRVVRVSMEEAEQRWPGFVADARQAGFGSFLSAPLVLGDGFAGAINCYSRNGHGFADIDEQLLELYATAVEAALRTHRRYSQACRTIERLRAALPVQTPNDSTDQTRRPTSQGEEGHGHQH